MKTKMKTIPLFLAGTLVAIGGAMAQIESETVTAKKVNKEEVPVAVVASIGEDFPEMGAEEWAILPGEAYLDEWVVTKDDDDVSDPDTFEPEYYTVGYSGKGISGQAVYNAKGELVHSKEVIKDEALPMAISEKIAADYPGFEVMKDKEVIKDGNKSIDYYLVKVKKGEDKEKLYFKENGDLIRSKKDNDRDI